MGVVFFPRVTDDLANRAGLKTTDYRFYYENEGKRTALASTQKGGVTTLEDEGWYLSQDGIGFEKVVDIDHPELFFGPEGVVPSKAYAALCIIWTCKAFSHTGIIYPYSGEYGKDGAHVKFRHEFEAGTLNGDLTLELALYLKTSAPDVLEDEAHLMNEAGVLLGSLEDPLRISFAGNAMLFPIGWIESPKDPLWWVEFSDWDDPRSDQFSAENVSLVLNKSHKDYSSTNGDKGMGTEVLNEIFAAALFLMFEKVREFSDPEPWQEMISNDTSSFEPGSICGVLHQVSQMDPDAEFAWTNAEARMTSLKRIVDRRMRMGGDR